MYCNNCRDYYLIQPEDVNPLEQNIIDALEEANNPSGNNPFVTDSDILSLSETAAALTVILEALSEDEIEALSNSNASGVNPLVTEDAINHLLNLTPVQVSGLVNLPIPSTYQVQTTPSTSVATVKEITIDNAFKHYKFNVYAVGSIYGFWEGDIYTHNSAIVYSEVRSNYQSVVGWNVEIQLIGSMIQFRLTSPNPVIVDWTIEIYD